MSAIVSAARSAEGTWAAEAAARLSFVAEKDHDLVEARLKAAGMRSGTDWAVLFGGRIAGFVLWTAVLFASAIGVISWGARIPARHLPAAITAVSYLLIIAVAMPGFSSLSHRIADHFNRIAAGVYRRFIVRYTLILTAIAILYVVANAVSFNAKLVSSATILFYWKEFEAFLEVTLLGFIFAYPAVACCYAVFLEKPISIRTLIGAGELMVTAVSGRIPALRRSADRGGDPCLDSGMLRLLECVVSIGELRNGTGPAPRQTVKNLITGLELAASDLESYAVRRVPWSDLATRRAAAEDGARLAGQVRRTKAPLARAIDPRDYVDIAVSAAAVLVAWAHADDGSFEELIRDAPTPGRVSLWRQFLNRVWQAIVLAAAAVVVPFLPVYSGDHAAGGDARYALLTAAVAALATGSVPVWDTIEKALQPAS
jgi:hypothetical protein